MLRSPSPSRSISIHAPRTGSDATLARKILQDVDFNPRSPHGERHVGIKFAGENLLISIHAPRTGSDAAAGVTMAVEADFNPRSPHGERHIQLMRADEKCDFNPRSPHGERRG